jgi:putative ATPase
MDRFIIYPLLIKSGDFEGVFRRFICVAYEDAGLANSNMPLKVKIAIDNFRFLGMPEGARCLAQVVIKMALSPKSNSVDIALSNAKTALNIQATIPRHLKDASYVSAEKVNKATYLYPHNYKNNFVKQDYLPKELKGIEIHKPQNSEVEKHLNK